MEAKIAFATFSVTDFHSAADVRRATEVFNSMVRRAEIPADIQPVALPEEVRSPAGIRIDKMLTRIGLAESVTEAVRKIKAGAVEINGEKVRDLVLADPPAEMIVRAGKNWRKVAL